MKREEAYLVKTNPMSFRPNTPARIIGVEIIKPNDKLEPRPCYHVIYSDFYEDWIAISDSDNFEIKSLDQIIES